MFFNEIKLLVKNKSTLILSALSIAMSIIFCYFYLMDYSTVIYHEDNSSEIFYGLKAYEKQKIVEENRKYKFFEDNLIEELTNNIIELNKQEKDEDKEQFYRKLSPYLQGEYLVEKLNMDSEGDLFNAERENNNFYDIRKEVLNKKIRNLSPEKQRLFESLNDNVKVPFRYGEMNGWPQMLSNLSMLGLLIISVLGIASSSNFSKLYENESYEIIVSTENGRKKMVRSKILAHLLWNLAIGIICIILYLSLSFKYISFSGGESSIQMIGLYSPYNLTLINVLKILIGFIIIGIISATILANFISLSSKNSVISIGIYLLILLVHIVQSYYLKDINVEIVKVIRNILSFLPMSSADIYYELLGFKAFKLMNIVVPFHYIKIWMYFIESLVLFVLCERIINKQEVF